MTFSKLFLGTSLVVKTNKHRLATAFLVVASSLFFSTPKVQAQLINTTTPFVSSSDSFYENFNLGFGFRFPAARGNGSRIVGLGPQGQLLPNVGFRQNNSVFPPFGGFNPAAGASFGFGRRGANGGGFNLNFNMAQGNTRTNVTTAPSLTTMNGGSGFLFSGARRPFATAVIPVLGNQPIDNGVTRAINSGMIDLKPSQPSHLGAAYNLPNVNNRIAQLRAKADSAPSQQIARAVASTSSAARGDISIAKIKAQQSARLADERERIYNIFDQGDLLLANGKLIDARFKYREALKVNDSAETKARVKQKVKATR